MSFVLNFIILAWFIQGEVVDKHKGEKLPFANVKVVNTKIGTSCDEKGRFFLSIPEKMKEVILNVSYLGYKNVSIRIKKRPKVKVRIELPENPVRMEEVKVEGEVSLSMTEASPVKVGMRPLDIYTTPGASADPLISLKTYPSFMGDPDVASLSIRGGKRDETLVLLNGISYPKPYIYNTSVGGLFSTIPTGAVKKLEAFAGVLPVETGGRLSGCVLVDLEGREGYIPSSLSLSTGGGTLQYSSFLGNIWVKVQSYRLLAELNKKNLDYTVYPKSGSFTWAKNFGKDIFKASPFFHVSYAKYAANIPYMDGEVDETEKQGVLGISLKYTPIPWILRFDLGLNVYKNVFLAPEFSMRESALRYTMRFIIRYFLSHLSYVILGFEENPVKKNIRGEYEEEPFKDTLRYDTEAFFLSFNPSAKYFRGTLGFRLSTKDNRWGNFIFSPRCLFEYDILDRFLSLKAGIGINEQWDEHKNRWVKVKIGELKFLFKTLNAYLGIYYKRYTDKRLIYGGEVSFYGKIGGINFQIMKGEEEGNPLGEARPWGVIWTKQIHFMSLNNAVKVCFLGGKPYKTPEGIWKRLPVYKRVDLQAGRLVNIGCYKAYVFVELENLFDTVNISNIFYTDNKREVKIYSMRRLWVAGFNLNF